MIPVNLYNRNHTFVFHLVSKCFVDHLCASDIFTKCEVYAEEGDFRSINCGTVKQYAMLNCVQCLINK